MCDFYVFYPSVKIILNYKNIVPAEITKLQLGIKLMYNLKLHKKTRKYYQSHFTENKSLRI